MNFIENARRLAYWTLGYDLDLETNEIKQVKKLIKKIKLIENLKIDQKVVKKLKNLEKNTKTAKIVICKFDRNDPKCEKLN